MKQFECLCGLRILEIDDKPLDNDTPFLIVDILQHKSERTGKLFKKPHCLGTVTLMGWELKKFYGWAKNKI